ncbi:hypothetical protein, partial [Pseudomonas sp. PA-3-6H]|uniref:hypothetical protein n=1 Tax=Pseudomonas sp. PA-3-6H TaxID=2665475 RepID=UPI001F3B2D1A
SFNKMNRLNGLSLTVFISLITYSLTCGNSVKAEPAPISKVLSILLTGDVPPTNKSEGNNDK